MTDWSAIDDGLLDPQWYASGEPHEALDRLRTEDPVHRVQSSKYGRPFWAITSYGHVVEVLNDPGNFSSYRDTRPPRNPGRLTSSQLFADGTDANLNHMDPPLHTLFRRPVDKHFSLESMQRLRSAIDSVTDDLIAEITPRGNTDFVSEIAADLPMHVIMTFLGVPRQDWEWLRLRVWEYFSPADPRFAVTGQAPEKTAHDATAAIWRYSEELGRAKRADPTDDFASALTKTVVDQTLLDEHEVAAWLALLIGASLETTRDTAAVGLWAFHQNPDQRRLLIENPSLAGQAVDEVLRWATPVRSRLRVARFDTTVGGRQIKAGDWVVPFLSAANHDPSVFEDPHAFNILRESKKNLSLGEGIHICLGLHLVRFELMTLFTKFFAAFPDYELPTADEPAWLVDHVLAGFSSLHVAFNVSKTSTAAELGVLR